MAQDTKPFPPGSYFKQTLVDEVDADTTYFGYARRGVATSTEDWLIKKVSKSGTVTTTAWASEGFDQEWDERTNLTYT